MAFTDQPSRSICRRTVLLALCGIAIAAEARVFTRWSARDDIGRAFESFGGRRLYESQVTINNSPGELVIYGTEHSLAEVLGTLRESLGAAAMPVDGGHIQTVIADDSTALRLVVVQPDPAGPTVAFTIRQSAADYAQSQQPPEPRPIAGAAPYPGSVGTFFATDSQAGAAFAVTRADAAADDIQRFFHAELRAAGWRPLIVNRSAAQASRLAAYARGPELCFLLVTDSPPDRAATITLLHKRAGMK